MRITSPTYTNHFSKKKKKSLVSMLLLLLKQILFIIFSSNNASIVMPVYWRKKGMKALKKLKYAMIQKTPQCLPSKPSLRIMKCILLNFH